MYSRAPKHSPIHARTPEGSEIKTIDINQAAEALQAKGPAVRVMLLEDRQDFREVLQDFLESRGFEVVAVESGIEGLTEIMKGRFDLIVCDIMMPKMGGEMFYWAVTRARPATARRFIFFTGHRNNPAIEFFFRRIDAPVLLKPFPLADLDSLIREVFRKAADARA